MLPKYPNFALNFLNLPKISARNIDSQELPELLNHQIHNHHQNSLIHKNRQINQKHLNPQKHQILRNCKNNKICQTQGSNQNKKKRFNSGIARIGGGGLPLPEFFCTLFYLSKSLVNGRDVGR